MTRIESAEGWKIDVRRGFVHRLSCRLKLWLEHGPAIVDSHPVGRVELTERRPNNGHWSYSHRDFGDHWGWLERDSPRSLTDLCTLPAGIWEFLRDPYEAILAGTSRSWMLYTSEASAVDAASDACIAWAKAAANLGRGNV